MIHSLFSDLPTFKNLTFQPGLNVLLAQKIEGATEKQTRNRAGKSSLVEIIHFLLGGNSDKDHLMQLDALREYKFGASLDLASVKARVERSGASKGEIKLSSAEGASTTRILSNPEWNRQLGKIWFGLEGKSVTSAGDPENDDVTRRKPTFRSLFAYFARSQGSGAFTTPEKQATMQQVGDQQIALMYLLGLDSTIAADWQIVRDHEKALRELKKSAKDGSIFGHVIGKAADLRTQLAVAEGRLTGLRKSITDFRVLDQYGEMEKEASRVTRALNDLANDNTLDHSSIREIEDALGAEVPPAVSDLEQVYQEAGVALPQGLVRKHYADVRAFHESVIRNRKSYLESELLAARARIDARQLKKQSLDARRAEIMAVLQSHGALDQFHQLQRELNREEAQVGSLRSRFEAAQQLESSKTELQLQRSKLSLRLQRDFNEQGERLNQAIRAFEEVSNLLYESAGSMQIDLTDNGPVFGFPMQGARSKGIKNMQIFCFDMMLMRLCQQRKIGPGFLVHDSHLFDGVDGRQIVRALRVGSQMAQELGFQYIVTMNEDDAFKETEAGFDVNAHVLPLRLTDATEDGGLFGFRF